ncbi:Oligoxyloglucan reducing end-specific cellobiohydrolase [Sistotremastrum niveocremeum HHB9708]|uniref:Oligoxyloglucan reducing end-specific cellobiohydrolase n=1 Tax=Sistotremastrum niveocremeum HHB9708 TaxID=1314777 RepID=A0A164YDX4_9AGAM|nr:Oligoxyloglucan reducing end-specific cellobiohydrolase [Sistotremastrum niveocremeum HHB9708]
MHSLAFLVGVAACASQVAAQAYTWKNVHTGGGGGWVGNVIFNTKQKNLAFLRTDIGGAYKYAPATDSWIPLVDWANNAEFDYWGTESIATDPVNPNNLYIEVGLYTNSWDPNNGTILKSTDQGATFTSIPLPFKVGGNMPGRGAGERLVIDPNNNNVLYLGARSGHGLWKSTNAGLTWTKTSLTATGTFAETPSDTSGYNSDPLGVGWIVVDTTGPSTAAGTSRIFVGVESIGSPSIWVSTDAGATFTAVPGQITNYLPHHGILAPAEKSIYVTYVDESGPFDGSHGVMYKYNITAGTWSNITPAQAISDNSYGFGGISIDAQRPGVVMAASLNQYYPDAQIWRSLDGGASWSTLYNYSYPPPNYQLAITRDYTWDISVAPWIQSYTTDTKQIGWGIEGLQIDPFDSNHFLYGTGLTLYGSHNLEQWDTVHNITLACLSQGIEETAVLGLVSPPTGAHLVSVVGDIGGWVHDNLDVAPPTLHVPVWGTSNGIDYAGNQPLSLVRTGGSAGQLATSTDGGHTWTQYANAGSLSSGKVAYSANATSIIWTPGSGVYVAKNGGAFVASTGIPSNAIIATDKSNDAYVYGAANGRLYVSKDGGATFTLTNVLGSAQSSNGIAVNNLGKAGELWTTTEHGMWHSTDFGKTVIGFSGGLTQGYAVAVGAPSTTGGTPSVFVAGTVNGVAGFYRTDNNSGSWSQIDTPQFRFGSVSGALLAGDPRIYRRVYIGTNGRGIFYGN